MTRGLRSPREWLRWIASNTKRLAILIIGAALIAAGGAMLILPGPGLVVAFAGLAVLATEFAWAERTLDRTKAKAKDSTNRVAASAIGRIGLAASGAGMLVGGAITAAISNTYRAIGIGIFVAGACALGILLPATQRWLNHTAQSTSQSSERNPS